MQESKPNSFLREFRLVKKKKKILTMNDGTWASVVAISTGTPSPSTIFSKRAIELGLWMIIMVSLVKQLYAITNDTIVSRKYYHFINEFTQWTIIVTKGKVPTSIYRQYLYC